MLTVSESVSDEHNLIIYRKAELLIIKMNVSKLLWIMINKKNFI